MSMLLVGQRAFAYHTAMLFEVSVVHLTPGVPSGHRNAGSCKVSRAASKAACAAVVRAAKVKAVMAVKCIVTVPAEDSNDTRDPA